jgi:hypothetical protein
MAAFVTGQDSRSGAGRSVSIVIGMNEGIKTVIYPVKDVEKAKA